MTRSWENYPFSAVLEGIASAFTGAIGFITAIIAGVIVGFASHGMSLADTQDGFFMLYLFTLFPLGLFKHLLDASGVITALCMLVLTVLFFTSDKFGMTLLLGLFLTTALYTFQAIALIRIRSEAMIATWPRFSGIVLAVVVVFAGARSLVAVVKIRNEKTDGKK